MAAPASGCSCRVWLPDSVLSAGEKLKAALQGAGEANIEHLRKKHPGTKFTVKGQPSTDPAPWRRLHVVIQCTDPRRLEKAESDVVDLCETACDVAADILGLSDDAVQDAFEGIRVERQEAMDKTTFVPTPQALPPVVPARPPSMLAGFNNLWQLPNGTPTPGQNLPGGMWPVRNAAIAQPTSKAIPAAARSAEQGGGSNLFGTTPKSSPFKRKPPVPPAPPAALQERLPPSIPPAMPSIPPGMPPGMPPLRPPLAASTATASFPAVQPAATAAPGLQPADAQREVARLAQAWVNRGTVRRAEAPAAGARKKAKKKSKNVVESDPYMAAASDPYMAADADPYELMAQGIEEDDQLEAATESSATTVSASEKTSTQSAPVAGAATVQSSEMPPPTSATSHKRKSESAALDAASTKELESKEAAAEAASDSSEAESDSEEGESDSDSEGEESEDAEEDAEVEGEDDGSAAGSRLQLFKLGARCCSVVTHFVGGSASTLPPSRRLNIDQRVRLEHCRKHLQWAGELAAVWHLAAADPEEKVALETLCSYFVSRKRVGLAEHSRGVMYIVPPDESFLTELGLPAAPESLAGSLLGLQVPHYEAEAQETQDAQIAEDGDTQAATTAAASSGENSKAD
eukprot:TRINITY_DN6750_c0_g1_i1.p1 TRINITY_DN6750_c0_g1~~TRINITY_DN6750_c0_g1_i1.p1  ORF type:complete len:632 (-),score=180.52 TRINITY_DN6750_c0_g1_i1:153-2048(-)